MLTFINLEDLKINTEGMFVFEEDQDKFIKTYEDVKKAFITAFDILAPNGEIPPMNDVVSLFISEYSQGDIDKMYALKDYEHLDIILNDITSGNFEEIKICIIATMDVYADSISYETINTLKEVMIKKLYPEGLDGPHVSVSSHHRQEDTEYMLNHTFEVYYIQSDYIKNKVRLIVSGL